VLAGSASGVLEARFSADSNEVVTANNDGTIRVWYSRPRELRADFTDTVTGGGPNPVGLVTYLSQDRILSLDNAGHLYVSTADGVQTTVIPAGGTVTAVGWNRAGTEVLSAQSDGTVDLWQGTGTTLTRVSLPSLGRLSGQPMDIELSPDGSRIMIVTSDDYTIELRDGHTGKLLRSLTTKNPVALGAFTPSGQILAGDSTGQVEVWDADGGHHRVLGNPGPSITDIESNRTGSAFVTVSAAGIVKVWATGNDRPQRPIDVCPNPNQASFSPDGMEIVIACGGGSVQVFDAAAGQILTEFQATEAGNVTGAAFSPDGKSIVTSVDDDSTGCVQTWNAELTTTSVEKLEQITEQRIPALTQAQLQTYLTSPGG
jgi:WD40 repeat protein